MAMEIRSIEKRYGAVRALGGVTLTLEEGKIYGLLGSNGAGKSTLLNLIGNRTFPTAGTITLDGETVFENDAVGERICLAGESFLEDEDLRVEQAFRTAAMLREGFDFDRAVTLAARFGLDTKRKLKQLSTGYASIFRLISALSTRADYILLDEPVLGLDAKHRDLFYRILIETYAERGCTIVLSTHLIAEVSDIIEHAIILSNGRVVVDSEKDAILADCCTVTGPAAALDDFLCGRDVLSVTAIGGLKTACLRGLSKEASLPPLLERGEMNLQDYFIHLMEAEGEVK